MKCFVYRNLHKSGYTYSIKALEGEYKGRVVAYSSSILIEDARLVINETGRQRVLQSGQKNVHAGIVGNVIQVYGIERRLPSDLQDGPAYVSITTPHKEIKYNPYKAATFCDVKTNEPIHEAKLVGVYGALLEAYDISFDDLANQGSTLHPSI